MLHAISARCVARDLHTVVLGHLTVHVGDSSQRSNKSQIAPLNAIITVIIIIIMMSCRCLSCQNIGKRCLALQTFNSKLQPLLFSGFLVDSP